MGSSDGAVENLKGRWSDFDFQIIKLDINEGFASVNNLFN
jgi:hypothetical protein